MALNKHNPAPSGETLGKVLLMPFCEAPTMRSGVPPLPLLKEFDKDRTELSLVGSFA